MNKFINLLLIVVGLVFVMFQYIKWTLWALPSGWIFMMGIIIISAVTALLIMLYVASNDVQKEIRIVIKKLKDKINWVD